MKCFKMQYCELCPIISALELNVEKPYHVNAVVIEQIFQKDYPHLTDILYLLEHCCLKTSIESVVESIGSVMKKHVRAGRLTVEKINKEVFLDWNVPKAYSQASNGFIKRLVKSFEVTHKTSSHHDRKQRQIPTVSKTCDRLIAEIPRFPGVFK